MKGPISFGAAPAPFIHDRATSPGIALGMTLALLPAAAWGIWSFGMAALLPLGASVAAALAGEAFAGALRGRFTLGDMTALLTGLLIGLAMPPGTGPLIPAAGAFFAVLVVKAAFGGLGSNWMNPALGGILFCYLNWPATLSAWLSPRGLDGLSGSTPLAFVRERLAAGQGGEGPLQTLVAGGFSPSAFDLAATSLLNRGLLGFLNADLPGGYLDLLLGRRAGTIGELSGLLLLGASILLVARRWIRWQIPAWLLGSYALVSFAFGGLPFGAGLFTGDALFGLFSGSLLLVAFFMATDPVSSPRSPLGMALFGMGAGILTFILRSFGSRPEGTAIAVLVMNCLVPLLERRRLPAPATPEAAR